MRKVLFLYSGPDFEEISLSKDQKYAYERLYTLGQEQGITFLRSPITEYNRDSNTFSKYWEYNPGNKTWEIKTEITPDLIIDKCKQTSENFEIKKHINSKIPLLNHPYFTEICDNKMLSYLITEEFSPVTKVLNNNSNLLDGINSEKIVLKPIYGSGGEGVKVIDKKDLKVEEYTDYLLQEYIETRNGINSFERRHDLRVIILNHEIVMTYIRSPRSNDGLISNVALGGEELPFEVENIPDSVKEMSYKIDNKFSNIFNNLFYSIDFLVNENQKAYVVEINSKPGLYPSIYSFKDLEKYDMLYRKLISLINEY